MKIRRWMAWLLIPILLIRLHGISGQFRSARGEILLTWGEDPYEYGVHTVGWQDLGLKKAEKLSVYSAPYDGAWRGAKGRAAVNTKEPFSLLGTLQGGAWGLIEYRVNRNDLRVGWIELPETAWKLVEFQDLYIGRTPLRTLRDTYMTDDPRGGQRVIRRLTTGETVTGMFRTGEGSGWVYAETRIDGKPACGFIPEAALGYGEPMWHTEGDTLVIHEGVSSLGDAREWRQRTENHDEMRCEIQPGDVWLPGMWLYETEDWSTGEVYELGSVRRISFPHSLRNLGLEALAGGALEELRLENRLRMNQDALYGITIERMILATDYTGEIPAGEYVRIGEWQVEDGNPRYSARDGVLYSADGKTLLRYPNGREAEHYDVPAGTEIIGKEAFYSNALDIRLKSISLPVGLHRIEARAFAGCGRLQSLTVPLTVTELDPSAFQTCVSLERLSLPPGLTAEISEWVQKADFTWFNGDNGSTLTAPLPEEEY